MRGWRASICNAAVFWCWYSGWPSGQVALPDWQSFSADPQFSRQFCFLYPGRETLLVQCFQRWTVMDGHEPQAWHAHLVNGGSCIL